MSPLPPQCGHNNTGNEHNTHHMLNYEKGHTHDTEDHLFGRLSTAFDFETQPTPACTSWGSLGAAFNFKTHTIPLAQAGEVWGLVLKLFIQLVPLFLPRSSS